MFLEEEYEGEQLPDHVWNEGIHAGGKDDRDKKAGTVKKTITGLKAGKKYYIRIRSCKTVNKKKYYSSWSKTVNIRA